MILPCLPERSPTWQVCGSELSQVGVCTGERVVSGLQMKYAGGRGEQAYLAADEGVEMAESAGAVAVGWDRCNVDMVD